MKIGRYFIYLSIALTIFLIFYFLPIFKENNNSNTNIKNNTHNQTNYSTIQTNKANYSLQPLSLFNNNNSSSKTNKTSFKAESFYVSGSRGSGSSDSSGGGSDGGGGNVGSNEVNEIISVDNGTSLNNSIDNSNATENLNGSGWLDFDGMDDYVNIPDNEKYSPINNKITFFVKFRRNNRDQRGIGMNGRQYVFDKGSKANYEYSLFIGNGSSGNGGTNAIYFQQFNRSGIPNKEVYVISSGGSFDTWYHPAIVVNQQNMISYHEGKYKSQSIFNSNSDTISNITLGKGSISKGEFNGSIAEFRIYDTNLVRASLQTIIDESDNFFDKRIIMVMYHTICDTRNYCVNKTTFESHMAFLNATGYTTITDWDYYNAIKNNYSLPKRPIILTFDDGLNNTLIMASIMKDYGFKGVIALNTNFTGSSTIHESKNSYLNWSQVKILIDLYNWSVASHGFTHCYMDEPAGTGEVHNACNTTSARRGNLSMAKSDIINHLGFTPIMHIYPYNSWSEESMQDCLLNYSICTADAVPFNKLNYITINSDTASQDMNRLGINYNTTAEQLNEALNFSYGLEGLVGKWKFDKNSGAIAYDSSGYGNNGTIFGAVWRTN